VGEQAIQRDCYMSIFWFRPSWSLNGREQRQWLGAILVMVNLHSLGPMAKNWMDQKFPQVASFVKNKSMTFSEVVQHKFLEYLFHLPSSQQTYQQFRKDSL
jgi:hypothetical protein